MAIHRLNHAVLYVRDAERSADFYERVLGFRRLPVEVPGAVFMQAEDSINDHDLGLFSIGDGAAPSPAGRTAVGLYHLAWEVDTLADLADIARRLGEESSLVGATDHGTTKALYGRDPDGIDFEVAWLVPADLITEDIAPVARRLDLDAEIERYGAETPGGVGVSRPRPVGA
ncbi:MAG TPA: VOC family protein [Acidimicrobiia bacterium]|nr:VOC family protein [Acidimicrobiia bacterium]